MKAPETHPADRLSSDATLDDVRDAAAECRACDLWRHATQTVFGAGAEPAPIMLVGEQPGDQEDLAGQPFVGPAGRLLGRGARRGRSSIARACMSPTRSSTSSGPNAASGAFTRNRASGRFSRAGRGCCASWRAFAREQWCAWEPQLRAPCSVSQ